MEVSIMIMLIIFRLLEDELSRSGASGSSVLKRRSLSCCYGKSRGW